MTDPIADMFTRIRNALAVRRATVIVPHSKVKVAILNTLKTEGYIVDYELVEAEPHKNLLVKLKYSGTSPAITKIQRLSKPGRRLYMKSTDISTPLSGYGITIVTTNQGIMTNQTAKKRKLGGEVICQVW